ncbi:MAG: type IV pilin protein [Pseudoxanthomonas sp.]
MKRSRRPRRGAGFTLIELMIVVAIVAILATIAYASYSFAVVKSRRAAAAGCLQERAQFMERYYTTNMTYADAPEPAQCDTVSDFYVLAFVGEPDASSFEISATPQGAQASADTKCGTLSIDQTGERSISGTAADAGDCW